MKARKTEFVRPEDRALLGSNPSAAMDSYNAGLGGLGRPGRLPAGTITKRKIHVKTEIKNRKMYLNPQFQKGHSR
jgi:hypothetical protein